MRLDVLRRGFGLIVLCTALAGVTPLWSQDALNCGNGMGTGLMPETIDVWMNNGSDVQGFVLAMCVDETLLAVTDVSISGTVTEANMAELVVPEIFPNGYTLGVVMDAVAPFLGNVIPPGGGPANQIAHFDVMPVILLPQGDPCINIALAFCDGTLNNPILDNIIVVAGLSIGAGQGLGLNDGNFVLCPPPPDKLTIVGDDIFENQNGCAQIILNNQSGPVQGFVLAICNDPELDLSDINIDGTVTEAVGAEFVVPNIVDPKVGGTLGVVLDFNPPFNGQTIPVGANNHIANYCYTCQDFPLFPEPEECHPIFFCDNVLGNPPLSNVIVVAGLSLNPALNDGEMCCQVRGGGGTAFLCGPPSGPLDGNGDPVQITGVAGDTVQVCFFYREFNPLNNIGGFQLAVCFDCCLEFVDGSFTVEGSILDEVGAEFVNSSVDNNPNDGDGCEFVAGILLDALPPFEGQTVPPTATPLLIGCVDAVICDEACDLKLDIIFCDGVNGAGGPLINNLVVVGTQSVQDIIFFNCSVLAVPVPEFIRCDCNQDQKCDLADAATVLAQQFDDFPVGCEDACDVNDDGKINLADSVYILNYLFKMGPDPLPPFPDQGNDPTEDELTCEDGRTNCP